MGKLHSLTENFCNITPPIISCVFYRLRMDKISFKMAFASLRNRSLPVRSGVYLILTVHNQPPLVLDGAVLDERILRAARQILAVVLHARNVRQHAQRLVVRLLRVLPEFNNNKKSNKQNTQPDTNKKKGTKSVKRMKIE